MTLLSGLMDCVARWPNGGLTVSRSQV